ncbi:hypothetical protein ACRB8A_19795 (plasmid) [Arthrobacter sp. G.S.26]|uniref:hypothetical protein n=1 Tax=Arthrobacter sp. G.S.26 TaxID=3433706 RepID=UPI003D77F423
MNTNAINENLLHVQVQDRRQLEEQLDKAVDILAALSPQHGGTGILVARHSPGTSPSNSTRTSHSEPSRNGRNGNPQREQPPLQTMTKTYSSRGTKSKPETTTQPTEKPLTLDLNASSTPPFLAAGNQGDA